MTTALPHPPSREHPRSVTILGATGSVGTSTIDLIARNPDCYDVEVLTANSSAEALADQAKALGAKLAVVADEGAYGALKAALAGTGIEAAAGEQALIEAAARPSDWVMAAIVGAAGLAPTLAAVERGAMVALANKECLVCAGEIFMQKVAASGAVLLPVDSEHNAIFQVMEGDTPAAIHSIVLTASGGPFRTASLDDMRAATPAQAVAHPNWDMGAKISVDSATMMNKGLELIEAFHLFPVREDQIEIVVHPQSVIHSLVSYVDGSMLAQLGSPDMRVPIAYGLGWPARIETPAPRLNLAEVARLDFETPDPVRFPALRLTREALKAGGAIPTVMNAANEIAVAAFLAEKLGFLEIAALVEDVMDRAAKLPQFSQMTGLDAVAQADGWARREANSLLTKAG